MNPGLILLAWLQGATGPDAPITNAFNRPGTSEAVQAAHITWYSFWFFIPFILIAYILLLYVMFKFRDRGDGREPRRFHENNPLEFAWTVIPIAVVLYVALHSFPVLHTMEYGGNNSALNINVVGHQFFWEYKYPQYGVDISNDTLVLPANQVVDLDLTSVDVIHGFFVPALGIQEDALPGRITNLWFNAKPGWYKGQCNQLCGADHSQMLISVHVVSDQEFQQWLRTEKNGTAVAVPPAAAPGTAMSMPPGMKKMPPGMKMTASTQGSTAQGGR